MPDGWIPEKMRGNSTGASIGAGAGARSVVMARECSRRRSPGRSLQPVLHSADVAPPTRHGHERRAGVGVLGRDRRAGGGAPGRCRGSARAMEQGWCWRPVAVRDVRRAVDAGIPAELVADAPAHVVADEAVDVVVELMGGEQAAGR